MKPILVSVSGGRTSMIMARMIQTSPLYEGREKHYVFANTGKERSETLDFIKRCDEEWDLGVVWVEAVVDPQKGNVTKHRIVTHTTAVRNTDPDRTDHPFSAVIEKYGLPSNAFPHCTRELKLRPISSYMRSIGVTDYDTAIGIRADELRRATPKSGIIYPFVDLGITETMVRHWWFRQGFDLELKDYEGNCDLCFKKSLRKRLTILRQNPELAGYWATKEGNRVDPKGRVRNLVFDRSGINIGSLLEMSQDPGLHLVQDKLEGMLERPELFEISSDADWDFESPCLCASGIATEGGASNE